MRHRSLCFLGLTLFAIFYGFAFAIFARALLVQLTFPLVLMAGIALWAAPDFERAPDKLLTKLLTMMLFILLCWPDYLAFAAPGLPWVTALRLICGPMALTLIVCISVSKKFRADLVEVLRENSTIWKLIAAFALVSAVSIVMSPSILGSVNRFINAQIAWTAVFFASCYVFRVPQRVIRFAHYLWIITIFCCVIGLIEWKLKHLPWAGHVPSFLKIEDESVERIFAGTARAGTGVYRVQSKFSTSLGFGEFLALSVPFIIHLIMTSRSKFIRISCIATLPLILFLILNTDSRLALIGFCLTLALSGFYWSSRRWKENRGSILAPLMTLSYPAAIVGIFLLSFVWRRVGKMIWGTGMQQSSTDMRVDMYKKGFSLLIHNPVGHGIGQGGITLGFFTPSGLMTIDTYYVLIALEFGIVGIIIFLWLFILLIWRTGKAAFQPGSYEVSFLAPVCIALINFMIIKSVFAQQENHPLVFMIIGIACALLWQRAQLPNNRIVKSEESARKILHMIG